MRWKDASTSERIIKIVGNHQKLEERHEMDSPTEPPEGTKPVNIWF